VRLDCDDPNGNNEPQIAVDPADPRHMVASSNDFGSCCDEFYTTFDAGHTWRTGNISHGRGRVGSDPVSTFDMRRGVVLHASLNPKLTKNRGACAGDVAVSPSTDGGLSWGPPDTVARGTGCDDSGHQVFNDKDWMVTDNNPASPYYGRTYLTWSLFRSRRGAYLSSAIFEAQSDDGGRSWSAPREISGTSPSLCDLQADGPAGECDEDQDSVPTVAPDGTIYVAFDNQQNGSIQEPGECTAQVACDHQYLVVLSRDGGSSWQGPFQAATMEDGGRDFPVNVDGDPTLTGYQMRVFPPPGNIVADPVTGELAIAFFDNRAGLHDVDAPVTNTNIYLVTSRDGRTWSGPQVVDDGPQDQWFPWVSANPVDGTLGVIYNDRSAVDPSLYGVRLAQAAPGATFTVSRVNTAPSHPTQSVFEPAGVPGCEQCTLFDGDYINLAYGADGHANLVWTDMRDFLRNGPFDAGYQEFIYFARR
jgi:hypothetical protein